MWHNTPTFLWRFSLGLFLQQSSYSFRNLDIVSGKTCCSWVENEIIQCLEHHKWNSIHHDWQITKLKLCAWLDTTREKGKIYIFVCDFLLGELIASWTIEIENDVQGNTLSTVCRFHLFIWCESQFVAFLLSLTMMLQGFYCVCQDFIVPDTHTCDMEPFFYIPFLLYVSW